MFDVKPMLYWHYRKSTLGASFDFLRNSQWGCPYIIRLGFNGACTIYDTRKYSDMKRIDFNYFEYSLVSTHLNLTSAKAKIRKLYVVDK